MTRAVAVRLLFLLAVVCGIAGADAGGQPGTAPAPPPGRGGTLRAFTLPEKGWSLILDAMGIAMDKVEPMYEFERKGVEYTGQRVIGRTWMGSERGTGFILSVALKEAERPGDARACRDTLWARIQQPGMTRIHKSDDGYRAYVEYTTPATRGRNLHIFDVHEGIWVAISLMKVDYRDADAASFETLRRSVAFREVARRE